MTKFKLPKDFMLGTATASVQIEGGDTNNTWFKWCEEGHIKDSSSCFIANDHWNRVEEDVKILKNLNVQVHRMSLEWSRIEPSKGVFSKEAVNHYRYEISLLIKNNIKPLITLHHFSEPLWFNELGGWQNKESVSLYLRYVNFVIENLGDLVCEWITFNEPNVYTVLGYAFGMWPPGEINIFNMFNVQARIIKAHKKAYKLIHEIRQIRGFKEETLVGCAMHIRDFQSSTLLGRVMANFLNYLFNEIFMIGTITGRIMFPLPSRSTQPSKGKFVDFMGINYYTRNVVNFSLNPKMLFVKLIEETRSDKTELGWDIYPKGIYNVCKRYYNKYKMPIFITENGISDKEDSKRADFICDHLAYVSKAIDEGIPIQRYYYWTLMDNFEWTEGETTHFGLFSCDFKSQERRMRSSAKLFSEICLNKGNTI